MYQRPRREPGNLARLTWSATERWAGSGRLGIAQPQLLTLASASCERVREVRETLIWDEFVVLSLKGVFRGVALEQATRGQPGAICVDCEYATQSLVGVRLLV